MYQFAKPAVRLNRFVHGFTLQETLVSLLVAGILITGGTSLHAALRESGKTTATNELIGHLSLARSEAIRRRTRVMLCPTQDQSTCLTPSGGHTFWQHGWLLYADSNENGKPDASEIMRVHRPNLPKDAVIRTSIARNDVTYQPTGLARGSTVTFALCDTRGPKFARYVTISNSGRARVSRTTESTVRCT